MRRLNMLHVALINYFQRNDNKIQMYNKLI